jgi:hypothetical protein
MSSGRERRAARRENAWMFRQVIMGTYVLYERTFSCQPLFTLSEMFWSGFGRRYDPELS